MVTTVVILLASQDRIHGCSISYYGHASRYRNSCQVPYAFQTMEGGFPCENEQTCMLSRPATTTPHGVLLCVVTVTGQEVGKTGDLIALSILLLMVVARLVRLATLM